MIWFCQSQIAIWWWLFQENIVVWRKQNCTFWSQLCYPCLERGWSRVQSEVHHVNYGCGDILLYGRLAFSGTEELKVICNTMKSTKCCKILEDCLESYVQKLEPVPDGMFQQDIDSKHTAKVIHAWFDDNNIKVIKWPKKISRHESKRKSLEITEK